MFINGQALQGALLVLGIFMLFAGLLLVFVVVVFWPRERHSRRRLWWLAALSLPWILLYYLPRDKPTLVAVYLIAAVGFTAAGSVAALVLLRGARVITAMAIAINALLFHVALGNTVGTISMALESARHGPRRVTDEQCKHVNPYMFGGHMETSIANTVVWSGHCIDGYAEGPGVMQWYAYDQFPITATHPTGIPEVTFTGTLRRGEMSGKGIEKMSDGRRYEGDFVDSQLLVGTFITPHPDGTQEDGYFVDGQLQPLATYLASPDWTRSTPSPASLSAFSPYWMLGLMPRWKTVKDWEDEDNWGVRSALLCASGLQITRWHHSVCCKPPSNHTGYRSRFSLPDPSG